MRIGNSIENVHRLPEKIFASLAFGIYRFLIQAFGFTHNAVPVLISRVFIGCWCPGHMENLLYVQL